MSSSSVSFKAKDKEASCMYSHRVCMLDCLEGYTYCVRHILEDKAAPFKQCAYVTKAGRKCAHAALKVVEKKESFCPSHSRKSLLARQRASRKRKPGDTGESLLEELVAFTSKGSSGCAGAHEHRRSRLLVDSVASKALDYASSSDSETELCPLVENTWREADDSDAESIDSDQEDLLKYAGVYTSEEAAQILRDKLIRLQALYIDQFKRLKHMLIAKRRRYVKTRGAERDAFGSTQLYQDDPSQRDRYNKLKALQQYHRRSGKEALLQLKSTQRRSQASLAASTSALSPVLPATAMSLSANKSAEFPSCVFLDDGVTCNARVVPLSKYCQKHILHDQCQMLYRPCPFADSQCGRPVPTLLNTEFCSLHQSLPQAIKVEADIKPADVEPKLEPPSEETNDSTGYSSNPAPHASQSTDLVADVKYEINTDCDVANSLSDNAKLEDVFSQKENKDGCSSVGFGLSGVCLGSTNELDQGGGGESEKVVFSLGGGQIHDVIMDGDGQQGR